jgi:hypothetical protein
MLWPMLTRRAVFAFGAEPDVRANGAGFTTKTKEQENSGKSLMMFLMTQPHHFPCQES